VVVITVEMMIMVVETRTMEARSHRLHLLQM
jgi:hypothetical protein